MSHGQRVAGGHDGEVNVGVARVECVAAAAAAAVETADADADAAAESFAELLEAHRVVFAHHGVDERIDGRVGVGHKVHEPLDVGQPRGQTLRILHAQQHDLQRRPAHSEQNANDDEHCDHLFSTKKTSFIFFTKI